MMNKRAFFARASALGVPHPNSARIRMPSDVDQVSLVDVLATAQPRPAHAAAIENVGEAPLDHFAALRIDAPPNLNLV